MLGLSRVAELQHYWASRVTWDNTHPVTTIATLKTQLRETWLVLSLTNMACIVTHKPSAIVTPEKQL